MIEIPRALARCFKTVLRRSIMANDQRGRWPIVLCRADKTGLTMQARQGDVAVRYHQDGALEQDVMAFRGSLLGEIEGNDDSLVVLEKLAPEKGRARWTDHGASRSLDFDTVAADDMPAFVTLPRQMRRQPLEFLEALSAAAAISSRESAKYSLSRLQLRGQAGAVVATDGKQLLVWSGFTFPWVDDVLIPALPVYAALAGEGDPEIGRSNSDVVLQVGPWTLLLAVDTHGRFPNAAAAVPRQSAIRSTLRLDRKDIAALLGALPKMPGRHDEFAPVRVDLESPPVVRAQDGADGPAAEMILASSSASGQPVQLRTDRQYLRRALQLGFTEIEIANGKQPVCCRDRTRCYVWVPLEAKDANGDKAANHASSPAAEVPQIAGPEPTTDPSPTSIERRTEPMPPTRPSGDLPPPNGNGGEQTARVSLVEVITETEALRELLHDAFGRASRLLAALKQQRRQTKAVQQAMQSLKQLGLDR